MKAKTIIAGIAASLMFIFMASADNNPVKAVVGMFVCMAIVALTQIDKEK